MRPGILLLLLLPLLGGCGQELTAGGYDGRVETIAVDEPASGGAARAIRGSGGSRFYMMPQLGILPSGNLEVDASAVLVGSDGSLVPLTAEGGRVSLAIAAGDSARLGAADVAVGSYASVRVTFRSVEANVTAGLLSGALSVTGRVTVPLQEPLTIERAVLLEVMAGAEHSVIIDLNSPTWLATADPATKTVPTAAFANAIEVRVR